jgi:hypothetical protein
MNKLLTTLHHFIIQTQAKKEKDKVKTRRGNRTTEGR